MSFDALPVIGNWYRRIDRPQPFQVVAFDAQAGSVDIEYFDGTVDEWPISHWHGLGLEPCEAPQDWSGPFDNIERDEMESGNVDGAAMAWQEPVAGADLESEGADTEDIGASPAPGMGGDQPPARRPRSNR